MATYTPTASSPLTNLTGGTTTGENPTAITPNIGGDSIALVGRLVTIVWVTSGATAPTVTLDSVRPSDQGNDNNLVATLANTGFEMVTIDASQDRFKQTAGNVGYVNLSYSSVTGITMYAWYTN